MSAQRVLIVGAGLIGLFTAWWLRRAGVEVTLVERHEQPGREASWAGGGILSPLYPWRYPEPVWALAQWSMARYPGIIHALARNTGVDAQFRSSGLVILDGEEREPGLRWAEETGTTVECWDAARLRHEVPGRGDFQSALSLPWVGQVRNPRLSRALAAEMQASGVDMRCATEMTGLLTAGGKAAGIRTPAGEIHADAVVIAAGAWSGGLLPETTPIATQPVKGQMLLFKASPDLLRHILMYKGRYVIPRRDGRILAGSTVEHSAFDQATTQAAREDILSAASAIFPLLETLEVERQWAGLRPQTPGDVPVIDQHPDIAGLYCNVGQYRNGVVTAPASGRMLADGILGKQPILNPRPYTWPIKAL